MASEHAELLARASHYEAAADALAQQKELDARCVAAAFGQRCGRIFAATRAELAASQAENGPLSEKLLESAEKLQELDAEAQFHKIAIQN